MKGRYLLIATAIVALFALGVFTLPVNAQNSGVQDLSVTLGPGESATIPLQLWCLEFGKPFPQSITGPAQRVPDNVVKVVQTAFANGTAQSDPYQTQLAVWNATDNTWHDTGSAGHANAQKLVTDSQNANVSSVPSNSLDQVMGQGNLQVSVQNLTPVNDPAHTQAPYHGTADLVVKNTSSQPVTFTFVQASTFKPASGTTDQMLVGVQDASKAATLPTTMATTVVTETTVVTATETSVPAAVSTATSTPLPTETAAPVTVSTPEATTTNVPASIPVTGGTPGGDGLLPLLFLGLMLFAVGGGLAVLQKASARR